MKTILAVVVLSTAAMAQSVQVTGGGSSLFDAQGGFVRAYFAHSESQVGAGVIGGQFYTGVIEKTTIRDWNVSAGDVTLPFSLPTDFTSTSLQFPAVGLLASRNLAKGKMTLFTGATATSYEMPFVFGSAIATPTTGIFYERPLTNRLTFLTSEVLSTGKQSAIQSLKFKPQEHLTLSASGGVGSNSPFVSGRAGYETPQFTGIIAWTKHTPSFERIIVSNYSVTENNGLEARGAFNGRHVNLSADRENLLSDVKGRVIQSTVESLGLGGHVSLVSGSANAFYGTTNGRIFRGETAGVGATLGLVAGRFDVYSAQGQVSYSESFTERVTRHISVSQFIAGHSVNLGGEYHSNTVTASGGYAMSFLPALGTFQKVLSISLSLQLPHSLRIDGGTVTTPDGRTRWTGYATTYQQGPLTDLGPSSQSSAIGRYMYQGRCVTEKGEPVSCAVRIGKSLVYADSQGVFRLPTKKRKPQPLTLVPEEFMTPGKWQGVTVPSEVTVTDEVTVTVKQCEGN